MKKVATFSVFILLVTLVAAPQSQAATKSCKATQTIEEGPYYLADTPTRSNVSEGQEGKEMTYSFTVVGKTCKPIKGARIDVWYANAQGIYSGVESRGDDLGAGPNSGKFLRGTQYTNSKGVATFKGTYPGWYPARTIHIHQKIWVGGKEVLTTQTFFSDKQNAAVMALVPYSGRGLQKVSNSSDMVLSRGGTSLKEALMKVNGAKASFTFVVSR